MHNITDTPTDRQTDDIIMPKPIISTYCMQYDRL